MKASMVASSCSVCRSSGSILAGKFHAWQRTLGKKAAVAVCHAMFRVAYFVLKERASYIANVGEDLAHKQRERQIRQRFCHHCMRLRELGPRRNWFSKPSPSLAWVHRSPNAWVRDQ